MTITPIPGAPPESHAEPPAAHIKRPWSVTLLALGVLLLTVINLIRLVLSLRYWGFLTGRLGVSPIYLALTGFVWSVAGLFIIWGLWKAKSWAPRLMQAVALTYALYFWLDHIFLMQHTVSRGKRCSSGAAAIQLAVFSGCDRLEPGIHGLDFQPHQSKSLF